MPPMPPTVTSDPQIATQVAQLRVSNREEDALNNEPSMSGKQIIGIIIPPPDIRSTCLDFVRRINENAVKMDAKEHLVASSPENRRKKTDHPECGSASILEVESM